MKCTCELLTDVKVTRPMTWTPWCPFRHNTLSRTCSSAFLGQLFTHKHFSHSIYCDGRQVCTVCRICTKCSSEDVVELVYTVHKCWKILNNTAVVTTTENAIYLDMLQQSWWTELRLHGQRTYASIQPLTCDVTMTRAIATCIML